MGRLRITVLVPSVTIAGVCIGIVLAGPLNPPAGPVAPTYKTLNDVEPRIAVNATNTPGHISSTFRIAQAGSYYLTGNVIAPIGHSAVIEVASSGVTLDLGGFLISGGGTAQNAVRVNQGCRTSRSRTASSPEV